MFRNPSLNSYPNSNLNKGCVLVDVCSPEFSKREVWSDISLVNTRTEVKGNFSSHSMVIRIRLSLSNVIRYLDKRYALCFVIILSSSIMIHILETMRGRAKKDIIVTPSVIFFHILRVVPS
jgi:hypothetical protein